MKDAKKLLEFIVKDLNDELKANKSTDNVVIEFRDLKDSPEYEGEIHNRIIGCRLHIILNTPDLDTQVLKANLRIGYFPVSFVDYEWGKDKAKQLDKEYWENKLCEDLIVKMLTERILLNREQKAMSLANTVRQLMVKRQEELKVQQLSSSTGEGKTKEPVLEEGKIINMIPINKETENPPVE